MVNSVIPSIAVPDNYLNDPETEDLIFGDELKIGMIVVIGESVFRDSLDSLTAPSPVALEGILRTSQWCRVESIRFHDKMVSFIGLYHDGSKRAHSYAATFAWYVKKNSIPEA